MLADICTKFKESKKTMWDITFTIMGWLDVRTTPKHDAASAIVYMWRTFSLSVLVPILLVKPTLIQVFFERIFEFFFWSFAPTTIKTIKKNLILHHFFWKAQVSGIQIISGYLIFYNSATDYWGHIWFRSCWYNNMILLEYRLALWLPAIKPHGGIN